MSFKNIGGKLDSLVEQIDEKTKVVRDKSKQYVKKGQNTINLFALQQRRDKLLKELGYEIIEKTYQNINLETIKDSEVFKEILNLSRQIREVKEQEE
ncbi:MAG: hypothetical protein ACOCQR_02650 [bacterium]